MDIRSFNQSDAGALIDLWKRCGLVAPENDPWRDIERKARVDPELLMVGEIDGRIVASCMAGYEGHRGWINYVAVHPGERRRGLGRQMMRAAEQALAELGCPKINLHVGKGNDAVIAFYQALGYDADEVISLGKRLVRD